MGYTADKLRSKSWDEFAQPDAPPMHFIITVCDNVVGEVCPVWAGQPISAHWGFEDPAAVEGSEEVKRAAFNQVFRKIKGRVQLLMNLPLPQFDKAAIKREMQIIGDMPS
ncbi:hypothetical protein [Chitinimonas sp. BJB300]|uniref:hypothetical protein n=1 Tax=Chitinimonas sp. BJB300 TaxID=1559339 RepID=UPI0026AF22E1